MWRSWMPISSWISDPFALSVRQWLRPPKRAWRRRTRRIAARSKLKNLWRKRWTTNVLFDSIREAVLNWLSSAIRNKEGRVSSDPWNNYVQWESSKFFFFPKAAGFFVGTSVTNPRARSVVIMLQGARREFLSYCIKDTSSSSLWNRLSVSVIRSTSRKLQWLTLVRWCCWLHYWQSQYQLLGRLFCPVNVPNIQHNPNLIQLR